MRYFGLGCLGISSAWGPDFEAKTITFIISGIFEGERESAVSATALIKFFNLRWVKVRFAFTSVVSLGS